MKLVCNQTYISLQRKKFLLIDTAILKENLNVSFYFVFNNLSNVTFEKQNTISKCLIILKLKSPIL